jgi:hypothetical protein
MKTPYLKIIIVFTILFATTDCDKDNQVIDYRTPFIGNFSFISYSFNSAFGLSPHYYDTIVYQGSIDIDNEKDNVIIINYRPPDSGGYTCDGIKIYGSSLKSLIMYNGTLDGINISNFCRTSFTGSFPSKDSLHFEVSHSSVGGMWGQVVTGKRK